MQVVVTKGHHSHTKRRSMSASAMPATQNAHGCRQVPRLPRKVAPGDGRPTGPKRAARANPVLYVLRLPRKTKVDVTKFFCRTCPKVRHAQTWLPQICTTQVGLTKEHACHAKRRMSPHGCRQVPGLPRKVAPGHGQPTGHGRPKGATRANPVL